MIFIDRSKPTKERRVKTHRSLEKRLYY
jgi:hypothetical protein